MNLAPLVLFLACTIGTASAGDFDGLLAKMAQAYGGTNRLGKAVIVRETGRVEAAIRMGNSGSLVRIFEPPLKLRVQVGHPVQGGEVRVLDGGRGWRDGTRVTGGAFDAMLLQALRLDLPEELLSHKSALIERKPMQYRGKRLQVLELPMDRGMSLTAGIDPVTGRILFSKAVSANLPSGPISFETYYQDFRRVDGRLYAFKEVNLAGGFQTAETYLSKVEIVPADSEHPFQPQQPAFTAK